MAWTYSGNPDNENGKDAVRFLVGDTNSTDQLATDEEIEWALKVRSNIYNAAALIASGIATNFARLKTSVKIGPITEEYGNRAKFYADRAEELNTLAASNTTFEVYGGAAGVPLTAPAFTVGMHDSLAQVQTIE